MHAYVYSYVCGQNNNKLPSYPLGETLYTSCEAKRNSYLHRQHKRIPIYLCEDSFSAWSVGNSKCFGYLKKNIY